MLWLDIKTRCKFYLNTPTISSTSSTLEALTKDIAQLGPSAIQEYIQIERKNDFNKSKVLPEYNQLLQKYSNENKDTKNYLPENVQLTDGFYIQLPDPNRPDTQNRVRIDPTTARAGMTSIKRAVDLMRYATTMDERNPSAKTRAAASGTVSNFGSEYAGQYIDDFNRRLEEFRKQQTASDQK